MVVKTLVDSTTCSALASLSLLLAGSHSWKVEMDFADKFPILSLDCTIEFDMGGVIPEYVDHVIEVNKLVATVSTLPDLKSSPCDQTPIQPNPFTPTFTIVSQGHSWKFSRRCCCLLNEEEQRACCCFFNDSEQSHALHILLTSTSSLLWLNHLVSRVKQRG